MMHIFQSAAWRGVESGSVRIGTSWKKLVSGHYFNGADWKEIVSFVPPMTLSIAPPVAGGIAPGAGPATSNSVSGVPAGGQSPFTYQWSAVSGDPMTINTPTVANTTFTGNVPFAGTISAVMRCTATDSIGQVSSADITVALSALDINLNF